MTQRHVFGITVAILMAVLASPAQAVITAETIEFEAYLGQYTPEPGVILDDATTIGIRVGYNITQRFNVTGQLGFVSTDGNQKAKKFRMNPPAGPRLFGTAEVDVDLVVTDVSFLWNIRPNRKRVFTLYAGPGYAFRSADIEHDRGTGKTFDDLDDLDEDSFTFHAGIGFKWDMTDSFYLRLASRVRWFDKDLNDGTDRELTFGVGWKFGG